MAISEAYTGSETVTTTEWDLPSDTSFVSDVVTADGVYQLWLDLSALATGDEFKLAMYEKVASAGTQRVAATWTFIGPQSEPHFVTPAFILMHGWAFTLIKVAGTDRSITWSIRSVA